MIKTYYDVHILSYSGDSVFVYGLSYSQMMKIAHGNPTLQTIDIIKEYDKKTK